MYSCSSSLETSRIPLVFSSRSTHAYRFGFLKKLDLSFSFLFLRLLMQSALWRLARRLLISYQSAFRPSFLDSPASLQRLRSCLLLTTRSSISFSLLPFDLIEASLTVTSPYQLLPLTHAELFAAACSDVHPAFSTPQPHWLLATWSYSFRVGSSDSWPFGSTWGSSTSLSSSSFLFSCSASATLGPLALWLSARPWIPFVWPAHTGTVQGQATATTLLLSHVDVKSPQSCCFLFPATPTPPWDLLFCRYPCVRYHVIRPCWPFFHLISRRAFGLFLASKVLKASWVYFKESFFGKEKQLSFVLYNTFNVIHKKEMSQSW